MREKNSNGDYSLAHQDKQLNCFNTGPWSPVLKLSMYVIYFDIAAFCRKH